MRLLCAELGKLRRPLTWAVTGAAIVFCVLLAAGGAHNAIASTGGAAAGHGAAAVAGQLSPVAAGAEAAGLLASLPGALAIALLAGGHIGGEWSGRTMKNVLTQHGRRWPVLAAKLASLWLAGVAVLAACWLALAAAGPVLSWLDHLPAPHQTLPQAVWLAVSQVGRALLVLAVFAAIGLLSAMLTRNTIGTMAATAGILVVMLLAASWPGLGRWSPATWVQSWMRFPAGFASVTFLPTNFWSRFISASGTAPGPLFGLAGLLGLLAVCLAVTGWVFSRADVTG
jgi:ABC-type transport system involved in multi-copper enzyme maturation permease subunit